MDRLTERVARVRETLKRESAGWGRAPALIAVTKTVTPEEILPLRALNVTDIGENRVQVIREKLPALKENFQIHMIGRLQSNKVKYIIKDVCLIHSVDNLPLVAEIDRQAAKNDLVIPVLIQVNIAGEAQKGGVREDEALPLVKAAAAYYHVKVKGLMTMMPLSADRDELSRLFSRMRALFDRCASEAVAGVDMDELSMGMSQDFDLAARAGATMVRVGSALFGK